MHIIDKTIDFSIFMQISDIFLCKNMNFFKISAKDYIVSKSEKTVLFCVIPFMKEREKNLFFTIFREI